MHGFNGQHFLTLIFPCSVSVCNFLLFKDDVVVVSVIKFGGRGPIKVLSHPLPLLLSSSQNVEGGGESVWRERDSWSPDFDLSLLLSSHKDESGGD